MSRGMTNTHIEKVKSHSMIKFSLWTGLFQIAVCIYITTQVRLKINQRSLRPRRCVDDTLTLYFRQLIKSKI